ncbi:EAL domain-containing protein [Halochromatium roseum]|uniref:EAL domain-containing protein n=1 Tax=Halochromatium roseum TaxID=391920 RepID=UPI001913F457|nr:EAL domain-containing protein [Halochromatium roseum]
MSLDDAIDVYDPKQLDSLTKDELEALPCGTIRVDETGVILFYSRTQSAITQREAPAVLGRNFFTDVAPCTVVPEFYGRFRRGVLSGDLCASFEFVFDFEMEPVQVQITMRASERPGEFWIIVEPLHKLRSHDTQAAERLLSDKYGEQQVRLSAASFDFSQCDREPIATCATTQPFGVLLVLDPASLRIEACSANSAMYLGMEPDALLDQPLQHFLAADAVGLAAALGLKITEDPQRRATDSAVGDNTAADNATADKAAEESAAASSPAAQTAAHPAASEAESARLLAPSQFRLSWPGIELPLDVRVHYWRERILLELEPYGEMAMDRRMRGFDLAAFQRLLRNSEEAAPACQLAVESLRYLTGFERVVAYRFEPNQDGVVIAESILPGSWPSILGLRYPATDIPRQARALYAETPLRYAPSRDHAEVALLSRSLEPSRVDIGIAQLRAQSPIHRNYLKRFGVNGSMSLSLMDDQRLWGLIIFHNRAPHPVTPTVRKRLIELAGCLSGRLSLIEERSQNRAREQGIAKVNAIVGEINIEQPFPDNLVGKADMLRTLVGADLVQVYHHGRPLFIGQDCHLTAEQIEALLRFLRTRPSATWSTDCLSAEFEPAAAYPEQLAGVLVIYLDEQREHCLLFGRKRLHYTVDWGAEPGSLPFLDEARARPLGWPNRTFQTWREERTHHAPAWSATELATAKALKTLLQQVIVAHVAHFERLAQSLASQRDALQRSREEMRHRALHDSLTGLPNRAYFRDALLQQIERCWTDGRLFGVALLDIDHFKTINDTLGHDQGDLLLCAVAQRLGDSLPPTALIARLGGDEFALLLPQSDASEALRQAQGLIEQLRQRIDVDDGNFSITGSLGLTIGDQHADPSELLKQADLALYRAKEAGRNCARLFDSSLQTEALARLAIDRAVLGRSPALAIELMLQPQHPVCSRERGQRFEVLSRWRNKDGELIMPGDFIPAAERNGLIRAVTGVVVRQTLRLLKACLERGEEDVVMAVNISASDLEAQNFAHHLIQDLHTLDVPPEMLTIEITESMLLRMTPGVKAALERLARSGVGLALDDFGTGFSSMLYLRELPISELKIDRAFIKGIEQPHDRNLLAGMIAMAHSIGKTVVAEGIETQAQLEILRDLGCDWGQGYLWSKPVPPALAADFFKA